MTRWVRRLAAGITGVCLAGGGLVAAAGGAVAAGAAGLNPSTAANTATAVRIVITTAGATHQPGTTVVDVVGPGPGGGQTYEDPAPQVNGQTVTATVDFDPSGVPAGPGDYTVEVCDGSCSNTATMESFAPFVVTGAAPRLGEVSPIAVGAGVSTPVRLELTGSGFAKGATVALTDPATGDAAGAAVSAVTVTSPSTITANLTTTAAADPGPRTVTVGNTDGQSVSLADRLVIDPAPTLTGPAHLAVGQGASGVPVDLTGTGIGQGAVVTVGPGPADLTGSAPSGGVTVSQGQHDGSSLPLRLTVAPGAATGGRTLVVTNPDGGSASLPMTVDAAPKLGQCDSQCQAGVGSPTYLSSASLGQGASVTETVYGSGFTAPADVDFGPGISHGAVTVAGGGASLTVADVTVAADAPTGLRGFTVVNGDGGVASCSFCLTVDATTLTAVQPAGLPPNDPDDFLNLSGAGYGPNTTVTIPGLQVKSVTYSGPSQPLNVEVAVPKTATPGLHPVTMTDSDGGTATCAACFSVDDFSIKTATPATAPDTGPVTLRITGKRIPRGVRAELTPVSGVRGQPAIFARDSRLHHHRRTYTGRVDLTGAAPADYDVRLAGHGHSATCVCVLTVTAGAPTVTAVTSRYGLDAGDSGVPLTLTGSNFSRGSVVSFPFSSGVSALDPVTTYLSPTRLVVWVDVTSFAQPGQVDVTLTAPDGQTVTCHACLTVQGPPTVTAVTPTTLPRGATRATLTVQGSDFTPGTTVAFGPGITVEGTPTVTATSIRATVDVGAYLPAGPPAVTVTATDRYGATGSCTTCLTITTGSPGPGRFFPLDRTPVFSGGVTGGRRVQVAGVAGVPADADTAVLDVAAEAHDPTTLTLAPTRETLAPATLNVPAGNLVEQTLTVPIGRDGQVSLTAAPASVAAAVWVVGFYRDATGGTALVPASPARILDRTVSAGTVTVTLPTQTQPPTARAAVVAVTATGESRAALLAVSPAGGTPLGAVAVMPGRAAGGLFTVPTGGQDALTLTLSAGSTHVTLDVVGWYAAGDGPTLTPLPAATVFTTPSGQPLTSGHDLTFPVAGIAGIPVNAAAALVQVRTSGASATTRLTLADGSGPGVTVPVSQAVAETTTTLIPAADTTVHLDSGQADVQVSVVGYLR